MATNRADTLDPALLRPGRLDRKIEFPQPDRRQKRLVFAACTAKMNLSEVSAVLSESVCNRLLGHGTAPKERVPIPFPHLFSLPIYSPPGSNI